MQIFYLGREINGSPFVARRSQHWQTFVRNHVRSIVASDFLVAVTARFRVLYVLVVMEVGTRKILHCNVTAHPTTAWSLQQQTLRIAAHEPKPCGRTGPRNRIGDARSPASEIVPKRRGPAPTSDSALPSVQSGRECSEAGAAFPVSTSSARRA
jgi:hypothetical protein